MSLSFYIMQKNMEVLLFTDATPASQFCLYVLCLVRSPNLNYNVSALQAFAWTVT